MTLSNYSYNLNNGETFSYLKNGKKVQVGDTSETRGAGVGRVQDLKLEQIVEQFTTGNMILSEAVKGLRAKGATISMSQNNGKLATIGFRYQGKMYTISCNSKDAASQVDKKAHLTFAAHELKDLDAQIIKKYFQATVMENGKTTKYAFKEGCGYTSLSQLKNDLYQQYKNDLILDNFLAGRGMESSTGLMKTESGKYVTSTNFTQLADEIKLATGNEAKQLRKEAFNKFIKEFASGNVTTTQAMNILKAIGVESQTRKTVNGNYEYTIKFEGKTYKVSCNKEAAAKATDDKRVYTMSPNEIKDNYGLTDSKIKELQNKGAIKVIAQTGSEILAFQIIDVNTVAKNANIGEVYREVDLRAKYHLPYDNKTINELLENNVIKEVKNVLYSDNHIVDIGYVINDLEALEEYAQELRDSSLPVCIDDRSGAVSSIFIPKTMLGFERIGSKYVTPTSNTDIAGRQEYKLNKPYQDFYSDIINGVEIYAFSYFENGVLKTDIYYHFPNESDGGVLNSRTVVQILNNNQTDIIGHCEKEIMRLLEEHRKKNPWTKL